MATEPMIREYSAPIVRAPDGSAHSEQRQRKKRLMAHLGLSSRQWVRLRQGAARWPGVVKRGLGMGDPIEVILRAIRAHDREAYAHDRQLRAHVREVGAAPNSP